jgi:mRNA interferase MazF
LLRLTVEPTSDNGLRKRSQIMIDKIMTVRRERLGEPFYRLDDETMLALNRAIVLFLGLA